MLGDPPSLDEDNDANIVAQIVTVGGTLLLTSGKAMVEDDLLEDWFAPGGAGRAYDIKEVNRLR
ncbi:MAG: hypothetical protein F4X36_13530 [Gammaproteobacteria bacterium]|nr:hypothetical protein [Gammaproteobacteria bacterium]